MVERDLSLAAYEDQPLHLLHLSARESVEALARAQAAGVAATGEVTPHHLCLTDEAVRTLDPNVKMNPPLRSADDRVALIDGLRDGTIGSIATDHAPHARHEKDVPFEAAPFGVTGLETAFAALYTDLVEPGLVPLETLLERMSAGPARAYGLDAPRIAVGAPANLVLLDTAATWKVDEGGFRSRSANSWLLGQTLQGPGAAHRRERIGGARRMRGFLALEDGTVFRGESVGAEGFAFGEAVFTTAMTGLPGGRHRPELRRADRLLHGADGRQLRRRAGPLRVASPARARGRDARGARAGVDGLAARARPRRALRDRHALARAPPARVRRDARDRGRGRRLRRGGGRGREGPAGDGRPLARRGGLDSRARTSSATRAPRGSRSSTTAASARSSTGSRGRARP